MIDTIPSSQVEQIKEHFLEEVAFAVGLRDSAGFFQAGNQVAYKTDNWPCVQIFGPPIASMYPRLCQELHTPSLSLKAALEGHSLSGPFQVSRVSLAAYTQLESGGVQTGNHGCLTPKLRPFTQGCPLSLAGGG